MYDIWIRCGISREVAETILSQMIDFPYGDRFTWERWGELIKWKLWMPWLEEKLGFKNLEWYE